MLVPKLDQDEIEFVKFKEGKSSLIEQILIIITYCSMICSHGRGPFVETEEK